MESLHVILTKIFDHHTIFMECIEEIPPLPLSTACQDSWSDLDGHMRPRQISDHRHRSPPADGSSGNSSKLISKPLTGRNLNQVALFTGFVQKFLSTHL